MNQQKFFKLGARFADLFLATGGIVCLLIFANFFYLYGLTGRRHFASSWGPYLYYAAPVALGILCLGALRLRPAGKINLTFSLISVAVCIYGAEILLTLWLSLPSVMESQGQRLRIETAKGRGIDFDSRSKIEVIDDFRRRGMDAVPAVFPQNLLAKQTGGTMEPVISINGTKVLPLAGIANTLTVVCNESGQFLTYRSDEHGFHNPGGLWNNRGTDIVALGDSFVQGFCVPPEKNFVALIRNRYPATVNLGIGGDGPLAMLAILREYAHALKPKVVLWFYFEGNDLADLLTENNSPLLRNYLTAGFSQNLAPRQAEIDRALTDYVERTKNENGLFRKAREIGALGAEFDRLPAAMEGIMKLSGLRKRLGLVLGSEGEPRLEVAPVSLENRAPSDSALTDLLRRILLEAKKSVAESGGSLYFIYLPSWNRYTPTRNGPIRDREWVLQVAANVGLPIIDIHQVFMTQSDPAAMFTLRLNDHYTEEGNRLVAEAVLRSITLPR